MAADRTGDEPAPSANDWSMEKTCVQTSTSRRSCASMNDPPTKVPATLPTSAETPSSPTCAGDAVRA